MNPERKEEQIDIKYITIEKLPCFWKDNKKDCNCAPCTYRLWQSQGKLQDTVYHHGTYDVVFALTKEGTLFIHRRLPGDTSYPCSAWVRPGTEKWECGNIPITFDAYVFTSVPLPENVGGISGEAGGGIRGWLRSSGRHFSINVGQTLSGIEKESTCIVL